MANKGKKIPKNNNPTPKRSTRYKTLSSKSKNAKDALRKISDRKKAASELIIANKKLLVQSKEKEKRASELIIANKELAFQNKEKEKRAEELAIAKELIFQNEERKRAQKLINESQEKYRALSETSTDIILTHDLDGKITYINQSGVKGTEYSKTDLIGSLIMAMLPDEEQAEMQKRAGARHRGEFETYEYETKFITKSGKQVPVEVHSAPIILDGHCTEVLITARDITERKRAEETLRESEEVFRLLVEAVEDYAIIMLDTEGRVISWNVGAERIKGYRAEEIIGQHFSCFYPNEEIEHDKPNQELRAAAAEGHFENEGYRIRKDGKKFWANVVITALRDDDNKLKGFSKITRDITERKRADDLLQKAFHDLERSNKDLEQFAYVASHDLQEPLRMVSSFTQLLERRYKDKLDKDAQDFIAFAVDGANRMQRLINDLLEYSRLTTRGKEFTTVDTNSVLAQVFANLQAKIDETHAIITKDDLPVIVADESQMIRILQNLIDNALKFKHDSAPIIHLSAHVEGGFYIFSVRDNGIGIDQQYADKVFQIFQRLNNSKEYPGTGIGLAMCKRVIERHGGKIWFESELEKGTTFFFTIPHNERGWV
ncbi:MAG: PAS domain S-box protein [Bacteroidota bacterium]